MTRDELTKLAEKSADPFVAVVAVPPLATHAAEQLDRMEALEKRVADVESVRVALQHVSGALCDSGVVVHEDMPHGYARSIRELTAERDAALARVKELGAKVAELEECMVDRLVSAKVNAAASRPLTPARLDPDGTAKPELQQTSPQAPAKPVCLTCNDTHWMPFGEDHDDVMCTRCPTPCEKCRSKPQGPYCAQTPCSCECHKTPIVEGPTASTAFTNGPPGAVEIPGTFDAVARECERIASDEYESTDHYRGAVQCLYAVEDLKKGTK